MITLKEIFDRIGHFGNDIGCNDKGGTHTYLETYDKLFKPFQKGCNILEIGLALGDSIKLFDEYFDMSGIVGVDVSLMFKYESQKVNNIIRLIEADATKESILKKLDGYKFDIIIDDGSHLEADQIATFNLLKDKINPGGIYIIEDILNLEMSKNNFIKLHNNCQIIDMRYNGRFDNVLIVYNF